MKKSYLNPTVEMIGISLERDILSMSLDVVSSSSGDDWDLSQNS